MLSSTDARGASGPGSTLLRVGQVRNPQVRWLFDYWRAAKAERALMPRAAFDPIDLGSLLSNVLFVQVAREPHDLVVRVAGQEVEDRYGRSMRGMSIYDTFPIVRRKDTSHQWSEILGDGMPKYRRGPMVFPNDRVFECERIMLPLCETEAAPMPEMPGVSHILAAIFYQPLDIENLELTAVSASLIE
jgi:hypothetical protein